MKYCLDTNALITICADSANTKKFINYARSHPCDSFYVPSYAMEKFAVGFENFQNQENNFRSIKAEDILDISEVHFFTLDESMLGGDDILALSTSEFNMIDYSKEAYLTSGSNLEYPKWRSRKINDHLISEMSDSEDCDAIVTSNVKDFRKIPNSSTYTITDVSTFIN